MMGTTHLCVLYVATAGQQGNALGSDEEEIVLLIYVIIDMSANKVTPLTSPLVITSGTGIVGTFSTVCKRAC